MPTATHRLPLDQAQALALEAADLLTSAYERLVIAGSIRRRAPTIGDLELVAIPLVLEQPALTLWEDTPPLQVNLLLSRLDALLKAGTLTPRLDKNRRPALGERYQRLLFHDFGLDLFVVRPPAQFGVILAIRTGPAEYSHRLVTSTRQGGLLPAWLQVKHGALRRRDTGEVIPTPTEDSFYEAVGLPWLEPWRRT